jgi:hypothetical protein
MKRMSIAIFAVCLVFTASAQDVTVLVQKVKARLDLVNDYVAEGILKTDIAFIKAPVSKVKVYFKKPNKFRLVKEGGISILPKGGVSVNVNSIMDMTNFAAIAAGDTTFDGIKVKVVKVIPLSDQSNIVLSTLYIDEANVLIRKAVTTTKENGTFEMSFYFGKYQSYALPDKVIFSFNTKDYKIPKGISLEFDDAAKPTDADKLKNKKGKVEIVYKSYIINKGVDDAVFTNK